MLLRMIRKIWNGSQETLGSALASRPAGVSRRDFLRAAGVTTTTVAIGGMGGSLWLPEKKAIASTAIGMMGVRAVPDWPSGPDVALVGRMAGADMVEGDAAKAFVGWLRMYPPPPSMMYLDVVQRAIYEASQLEKLLQDMNGLEKAQAEIRDGIERQLALLAAAGVPRDGSTAVRAP